MATIDTSWHPVAVPDTGGSAFLGYSTALRQNATSLLDNLVKQRQADAKMAYDKENDELNRALKAYEIDTGLAAKQKELDQAKQLKDRELEIELYKAMHPQTNDRTAAALLKGQMEALKEQDNQIFKSAENQYNKAGQTIKDMDDNKYSELFFNSRAFRNLSPELKRELTNNYKFLPTEVKIALQSDAQKASDYIFGPTIRSFELSTKKALRDNAIDIAANGGIYYDAKEIQTQGPYGTKNKQMERTQRYNIDKIKTSYKKASAEEKAKARTDFPMYKDLFDEVDSEGTSTPSTTSSDLVKSKLVNGTNTVAGKAVTSIRKMNAQANNGGH